MVKFKTLDSKTTTKEMKEILKQTNQRYRLFTIKHEYQLWEDLAEDEGLQGNDNISTFEVAKIFIALTINKQQRGYIIDSNIGYFLIMNPTPEVSHLLKSLEGERR